MPGVPSSRGCDACRRQKKKCDESKPACGRCTRLEIECNGAGTQRYKFQVYTAQKRSPKGRFQLGHRGRPGQQVSLSGQELALSATPSCNAQTAITGRLVSALQVADPRFSLSVYGPFLQEIPRRIGSSPVLDAAVSALNETFPLAVAVPGSDLTIFSATQPTVQMLQKYGHALMALRTSLSKRQSIAAPDTLCALYLLVIVQGWLQQDQGISPSHGEAISMILSAMKEHESSWSTFEHGIVKTLSFLVIMESIINPRIKLDKHLRGVIESHPPLVENEPQATSCLSNIVLVDISASFREPYSRLNDLVASYDRLRVERAKFANLIASIPVVLSTDGQILKTTSTEIGGVHIRLQTGYATLTLIAIRVAATLSRVLHPSESSSRGLQLDEDFRIYINDLATVAEQAIQYYPLGSSFMPLCLLAAYATLSCIGDNPQQKARIMRLFTQYRPGVDFEREWLKIKQAGGLNVRHGNVSETNGEVVDILHAKDDMCCVL